VSIHPDDYDEIVNLAVEEVEYLRDNVPRFMDDTTFDEDEFHRVVFDNVLTFCDRNPRLSQYEAHEISDICSGVETDILHGDIRGKDRNLNRQ